MRKPKILYFDIETRPLQAWIWSPGKQYVGHKQLVESYSRYGIICIAYCWNDGKPAQCIDWGFDAQNTAYVVEQFDAIIKQADHIIGKNSDRFDVKMVNAARMFAGLPGLPEWSTRTDDLEKQMRKYFRMPSQSLDYISHQLGLGGKVRMEMQDWIDICEKNRFGKDKLKKMIKYCKKDVEDTRKLWLRLEEHFNPRFNMATFMNDRVCKHADCGSPDIRDNGSYVSHGSLYKQYRCGTCNRYAGSAVVSRTTSREGLLR